LRLRDFFKPRAGTDQWETLKARAGIALQNGDPEKALLLYDELIAQRDNDAEAYYKRGNALGQLHRWDLALASYDKAIALNPEYSNAFCNRGTMLERLRRWDEALASFDRAVELNPADYLAYYNRGTVLKEIKRFEEALVTYERAIELKHDYVEAHVNRGNVFQELERHEEAVASYDRAIDYLPIHPEAFEGRGASLLKLRRFESAIASYDRAISLNPNHRFTLGMRRYAKMQVCEWDDLESDSIRLVEALLADRAVCPPFPALSLVDSAALQRKAAQIFVREECPPDSSLPAIPMRRRGEKLRIGYFSADFRNHPVSLLSAELFETHDRSKFEVSAFAFGPETNDPMRSRLERTFDNFVDVRKKSDAEVALLARELKIDIAVDLGGFTEHSRTKIFALRAAPIQLSYLGYLGTMGAPYMDYLVADSTIVPVTEQQHYAEKIIYLPCYQVNDSRRQIADVTFTREELGIPPSVFVFSCFNSNYKITPGVFSVWMRILQRVEASVLFLYADNDVAAGNLIREARLCGIDSRRIIFGGRIPQPDYLARFRTMDLFLDTLPYNAGTTASDALWAGLPVLTCIGKTFAGRVAASLLNAIDLPELVTSSAAEYEELAVEMAANPDRLAQIKQKLARNRLMTPLFNTVDFTKNLEIAYEKIYERYIAGLPPATIYPDSRSVA